MKILIRAAFAALCLATILPVSDGAAANASPPPVQRDNQIGVPGAGWG
jgi:hypothetical protein